jgi:hypothetical protein
MELDSLFTYNRDSAVLLSTQAIRYYLDDQPSTWSSRNLVIESFHQDIVASRWATVLNTSLVVIVLASVVSVLTIRRFRRKDRLLLKLQEELLLTRSQILHYQSEISSTQASMERELEAKSDTLQRLMLYHRGLSLKLFETRAEHKFVVDFEHARRQKRIPRELSAEETKRIQTVVEEIFMALIRRLRYNCPQLSPGDIYCSVLAFMGYSNALIAYLMGVDANVITQRRYRIRGKMDDKTYEWVFERKPHFDLLSFAE